MDRADTIRRLMDRVREHFVSGENVRRQAYWDDSEPAQAYDSWRLIPNGRAGIPFVVELEPTCLSKIHSYDLDAFYSDPECYTINYLNNCLYKFETFKDCTPISKRIVLFLGASFEKCLLLDHGKTNGWADENSVIHEKSDLGKFGYVDFQRSKIMKSVMAFYHRVCELVDDDFEVMFPTWGRGPFGVAWMLRNTEELLIDLIEDPDWVYVLLSRITEIQLDWERQRAALFGQAPGNIYDDEVTSPMISPETYEKLIQPFETEISKAYGGLKYWHSCGNTEAFQRAVNRLPGVRMVHVSPWTSYHAAAENYAKGKKALEVALYGYEHVVREQPAERISARLSDIRKTMMGHVCQVRAAGIEIMEPKDLHNVLRFVQIANQILLDA